jgi:thymidylate synthase (FAD)
MAKISAEYIDHGNDDLTVVNAAKVSFNKQSDVMSDRETGLINYLATHNHWTPFAHCRFTFVAPVNTVLTGLPYASELRTGLVISNGGAKVRHSFYGWVQLIRSGHVNPIYEGNLREQLVQAMPVSCAAFGLNSWGPFSDDPQLKIITREQETDERFIDHTLRETIPIFTARQRFKHVVDTSYNEVSRRYVSDIPEFFFPEAWRGAPTNGAKQGSSETEVFTMTMGDYGENYTDEIGAIYSAFLENCGMLYNSMIKSGIAPEQARMVLPQSMMTSYYVTSSLISWRRSYALRTDAHAQSEIRDLAVMWGDLIDGVEPVRDYQK